jgi:hypothetical protein
MGVSILTRQKRQVIFCGTLEFDELYIASAKREANCIEV